MELRIVKKRLRIMKRCKKCVMTDTRPGITFNEDGICLPCENFKYQKNEVDWSKRYLELDALCDKYRKRDGSYDCVICVSGGKDSHFQVNLFKEILGMHPLCIMVDNGSWTKVGRENFYNISKRFDVDMLTFTRSVKKMRDQIRHDFLNECWPMKYWDEVLYRKPLELAQKLGIKLVIWGENTSLVFGGVRDKETPNAKLLIESPEEFPDLEVIFTSYYWFWSRFENVKVAMANGFKCLPPEEWVRYGMEGFEYEQIDTIGYLVNQYCKFIKFGFKCITELCSDAIRHGEMTREEAIKRVNEDDWKLDPIMLKDFITFIEISEDEFWETISKFVNTDLLYFDREDWAWKLKEVAK